MGRFLAVGQFPKDSGMIIKYLAVSFLTFSLKFFNFKLKVYNIVVPFEMILTSDIDKRVYYNNH